MKKYTYPALFIIILVAIIVYMACTRKEWALHLNATIAATIPIVIIAIIICVFIFRRCKGPKDTIIEDEKEQQTLQDLIATYGTPDDIIVTDATRGNEIEGAILAYDKGGRSGKGFFVCNGFVLDKDSITDITFNNNFGTAFGLPDEFQLVVSTNEESRPKVYIRGGNDIDMVKDIVTQMKSHL